MIFLCTLFLFSFSQRWHSSLSKGVACHAGEVLLDILSSFNLQILDNITEKESHILLADDLKRISCVYLKPCRAKDCVPAETEGTSEGLQSLGRLRELRVLNMMHTDTSDAVLERLQAAPHLTQLAIGPHPFRGPDFSTEALARSVGRCGVVSLLTGPRPAVATSLLAILRRDDVL